MYEESVYKIVKIFCKKKSYQQILPPRNTFKLVW